MPSLRLAGRFWLPEEPERTAAGHLIIDEGDCKLELIGALAKAPSFSQLDKYPRVLGELHRSAPDGGTNVTLLDAFTSAISWGTGDSCLETITPNRIFVGDVYVDGPDQLILSAAMAFENLGDWLPGRVVTAELDPLASRGLPAKQWETTVADARVAFRAWAQIEARVDAVTISKSSELVVTFCAPIPESRFHRDYLTPLANFVTLGTGAHARLQRVELRFDDASPWPTAVRDLTPLRRLKARSRGEVLFRFPEALDQVLPRWLELARTHRRLMGLFFGLLEAPPLFAEMRFDLSFRALDLIATRIAGATTLQALFASEEARFHPLVGDATKFIADAEDRRSKLWDDDAPPGMRLYYLTEGLLWSARLLLAAACGIREGDVTSSPAFTSTARYLPAKLALAV